MNLTLLVLFHFFDGAGGAAAPSSGRAPFIHVSSRTSTLISLESVVPVSSGVQITPSVTMTGSASVPVAVDVLASPSHKITLEVLP